MRRRLGTQNPMGLVAIAMFAVVGAFVFLVVNAMRGDTAANFADTKTSDTGPRLAVSEPVEATTQDSDKDGLEDWEEVLWNTDPHNPDTDGDGTDDGTEVNESSDPLVLGSGRMADAAGYVQASSSLPRTATQAVARDLMTSFMSGLKEGATSETVNQDQILQEALSKTQGYLMVVPYTAEEVVSVPSTDTSRAAYIMDIEAMLAGMQAGGESEAVTLQRIAQGEQDTAIDTLRSTTKRYAQYIDAFKGVQVPSDAASVHVTLVNALLEYNNTLMGIVHLRDDPVLAAASLNLYTTRDRNLSTALYSLKVYLDTHVMLPPIPEKNVTSQ